MESASRRWTERGKGESPEEEGAQGIFDNMTLTPAEAKLLQTYAPYLGGSPRRAKRFVNLYLLIKASLGQRKSNHREEPTISERAMVALLTVVTGAPHHGEAFFSALPAKGAAPYSIETLRNKLDFGGGNVCRPREEEAIRAIVQALAETDGLATGEMVDALHALSPTIQRYSFQGNLVNRNTSPSKTVASA